MKIAIIGAGISGLTAAYRLSLTHEITLFEANDYPGGHTNTVDVELDGERQAIDTGFIVFNDRTYPNFIKLVEELGVRSQPTSMSFSVRCDAANLEYNGSSLNGLFAQRRNLLRPSFYRMLADIVRFNREAPGLALSRPESDETTVREFLARHRYSREFAEHYLLPMGAAIWSCPIGTFENFPIRFIIEFYRNHGLLSIRNRPTWRVIEGGSRNYVAKMTERFPDRIRLSTAIEQVRRSAKEVTVIPRNGLPESFDHVIFACHSDQALRMLTDPTAAERDVLSEFPYERNIAVLHTDRSVLPRRRRAWASWNYHLAGRSSRSGPSPGESGPAATVTYQMNLLQNLRSQHDFNVTLNSDEMIDPAKVLRRFEYQHPIFTVRRAAAQARHRELINVNRTSFCGAYWGNGFHEDGVVSALRVCEALLPMEADS
ncbi:MAG: FAD-dependent oxidoreductase [Planctomycetota bacterium]|nr:FAD-dependent oxidoreductase [Planctomycetota bacterium]MDA1248850.1 FAD-dependent oxidoreductase [Planctomycetota bacterium]